MSNRVITGNCARVLSRAPAESVDLVFADPPYNIGFKYEGYDDERSPDEYRMWCSEWMILCHRVLKPFGSMFVLIGDEYAGDFAVMMKSLMKMRNWIIWKYGFGQNTVNKFPRCHAHLLYFTKSEKQFTFNADAVKIPSDRQTKYNDARAVAGGKIMPDVWDDIPRLAGTHRERVGWFPCQLPTALLARIIGVASNPGDLILDPFSGSGTTGVTAKLMGRRSIGIELSADYAAKSRARIDATEPRLVY